MKLRKDGQPRKIPIRQPMKQETKDKISERMKISSSWHRNKGEKRDPLSEKVKKKISASGIGKTRTKETKDKMSLSRKGVPLSEYQVEKIREAKLRFYRESPDEVLEEHYRKYREKVKKKGTGAENKFEQLLIEKGLVKNKDYFREKHIGRYIADYYFPSQNLIIEIQGCFWHACEQCGFNKYRLFQREKDLKKKTYYESRGYQVKYVWEHQLTTM